MRRVFLIAALGTMLLGAGCASNGGTRPVPDGGDGGDGATGDTGTGCATAADCVDDGVFCNGTVECVEGRCTAAPAPDCGDGVGCTQDECLAGTDMCQNTPIDSECPEDLVCVVGQGCRRPAACEFDADCGGDGIFCNGEEVCVESACVSPGMLDCGDTNNCTVDECVESSMMCMNSLADYLTDPAHCGPTGANDCVVCPEPDAGALNAAAACEAGTCGFACAAGFADADGDGTNGCECEIGSGTDDPDGAFLDENCDGIDGDLDEGILVSRTLGADAATCGLDFATPCQTISYAMTRAIGESRRDLFVMAGSYDEVVVLRDGIRVFGGYDTSWVRDGRADAAHQTTITGGMDTTDGQYVAVKAHDLIVAPTLENLVLVGPDAPAGAMGAGRSSYVVHAAAVTGMELIRVTLRGGNAGDGAVGSNGSSAPTVVATASMSGSSGGNASQFATACNNSSRGGGGARATNSCGGGTDPAGGAGGRGGTMDTDCGVFSLNYNARAGDNGSNAGLAATGGYGYRGAGGGTCNSPGAGQAGRYSNGSAGAGGTDLRGSLVGRYWIGAPGGAGGTGQNGSGGGGGGGSGGCDSGTDSYGAGGGGGGAGGCAAQSGGAGGGGGGGSFGIFSVGATVNVSFCEIQRGNGGAGGAGGAGGRGQSGGSGGSGGTGAGGSRAGGLGGAGSHGGHGGGGGGGPGGPSYGIFSQGSTIVHDCSITGGSRGPGGMGGASAPTAPVAERDGNAGSGGTSGTLGGVGTCTSPGAC